MVHLLLLGLFWLGNASQAPADARRGPNADQAIDETRILDEDKQPDVLPDEIVPGFELQQPPGNEVRRSADIVVPGLPDVTAPPGLQNALEGSRTDVPPPPGFGDPSLQGAGIKADEPGHGPIVGLTLGGGGGKRVPGGTAGRTGSSRDFLLGKYGGTPASETAVRLGLKWLVAHQAPDGHWSLDRFNEHGRCNCTGFGAKYDVAATAFGLLPLLGHGETHLATGKDKPYTRNVQKGLNWLVTRQSKDGMFSPNMYEQGLATIAMCEAYGLTSDPKLKLPAQRALDYICAAQSPAGGWRYAARSPGVDTSVGGWQLMALKSGQIAGLSVPKENLSRADRWLDAVMDPATHGYGYTTAGSGATTTAVGLLCREYRGWGPRTPELLAGVKLLKEVAPGSRNSLYHDYYATQVLYQLGGPDWVLWNEGKDARGKQVQTGMRDWLIAHQDKGEDVKHAHQAGSWSPQKDLFGAAGGRIMITSMALLTLEVYYRHLPLFRRELLEEKERGGQGEP
jgi:hypothetical protein